MALRDLLPLVILFTIVGGGAYILYLISQWSNQMAERSRKHMEKKNISFTKEGGLKVGVKEMRSEDYEDKTQKYAFPCTLLEEKDIHYLVSKADLSRNSVLVNVWNNASFPNKKGSSSASTATPSTSKTNSSQVRSDGARPNSSAHASGASTNLSPPASRGTQPRSASPVPGSFD